MAKYINASILSIIILLVGLNIIVAQPEEWVVDVLDNPSPGYFKIDYNTDYGFFLLDHYGEPKYVDSGGIKASLNFYKLMPNGNWICYANNKFFILNKDLDIIDSLIPPASVDFYDFHDIAFLSNGRYLVSIYNSYPYDMSTLVEDGKTDAILKVTDLYEVDKSGNIYWTWQALDHIEILDVTDDIDLTQQIIAINHINSIAIDRDGNILISSRYLDEVTKINRSTGNIMWRMGGSGCKNNQFTFTNDNNYGFTGFSHQHDITVLSNGNLLLFDNGNLRYPQYSRAVEYQLNQTTKTATKVWEFTNNQSTYSQAMGSAQRLPNGNTLINWVQYGITEVRPDNSIAFNLRLTGYGSLAAYRAFKHVLNMNAVTKTVSSTGTYSFNETNNNTNISITASSITGSGTATIEKHYYSPPEYSIENSELKDILPYRWVLSKDVISGMNGTINININGLEYQGMPAKFNIYQRAQETEGRFNKLTTNYNPSTKILSASFTNFGEFIISADTLLQPEPEFPRNAGIGAPVTGVIKWKKITDASKYHIQISKTNDFKQNAADSTIGSDTLFNYSKLLNNTAYYWRVRAMNSKDTSDWSEVFSFTTVLPAPKLTYPADNFSGFKLSDSLRWQPVTDAQNYLVQISGTSNFSDSVYNYSLPNTAVRLDNILALKYNRSYYWRVSAFRATDTSYFSLPRKLTSEMDAPDLVQPSQEKINVPVTGKLIWDKADGAEKYSIQISEMPDFGIIHSQAYNINTESYSYKDLNYNQKYYWRVKSVRSTDSSSWSEMIGFTTLLSKPVIVFPTDKADGIKPGDTLSWNKVPGAQTYKLHVSYESNFSKLIIDESDIRTTGYVLEEMPSKRELYWKVQAYSNQKISDWSETRVFTTAIFEPLAKPILLSPGNNSTGNPIEGIFIWSGNKNAKYYAIEVSSDIEFIDRIIEQSELADTSYGYSELEHGTTYYWRVKAYSTYDSSEWSDTWPMMTIAYLPTVTLINPGPDALSVPISGRFEWEPADSALAYSLQCSKDEDFTDLVIDKKEIKETSLEYSDLENFQLYYWRVKYITIGDTSQWSNGWSFLTIGDEILETPALVAPADNETAVPKNGELHWNGVEGAKMYWVTISWRDDFSRSIFIQTPDAVPTTSYKVWRYNTEYYWRVAALNDNSNSLWSENYRFLTELEPPVINSPENTATAIPYSGSIEWTSSSGAVRYHLQVASDSTFNKIIMDDESLNENTYPYNLLANTTYYCRVKALNDTNYSQWSNVSQFTTDNVTGVAEISTNRFISVSPNPIQSKGTISINLERNSDLSLGIYNLSGILVKEYTYSLLNSGKNTIEFYTDNLSNGLYILKVHTQSEVFMAKLIINK